MRCVAKLNDLKPRRRYQYIRDLKALVADATCAWLTTLCYHRASFLEKSRRTRRERFDKVSSYFWFTASEGFRHEGTDGERGREWERVDERGRAGGRLSASTIMRVESGWFGGYTGSDTGPKGVVTIRQRCRLLRPQPLNNLLVLTTRPPHRYRSSCRM